MRTLLILLGMAWSAGISAEIAGADTAQMVTERARCTADPCSGPAIVFVHGIWGSEATWKNPESGATWPQLLAADHAFDSADIYRVDYHSRFISLSRQPTGAKIVEAVFLAIRDPLRRYPRVYFVAHSMGGNIVRDYLVTLKASTPGATLQGGNLVGGPHEAMRPYTHGIFLLGTPMEGAKVAQLGQVASTDPALRVLLPIDLNDYLQLLNRLWGTVTIPGVTGRTLATIRRPLRIYAGCETREFHMLGLPTPLLIVPEASALALAKAGDTKCFDRDHSSLVKPKDSSDVVYRWIAERITAAEHEASRAGE